MLPRTPGAHAPRPGHLGVRQVHPPTSTAGNMPLTRLRAPRPTTPYTRIEGHSSTVTPERVIDLFHKVMDEIHRGREEHKKMAEDIKGIRQTIGKLEANYRKLWEDWKQQNETTFTIESSVYKV